MRCQLDLVDTTDRIAMDAIESLFADDPALPVAIYVSTTWRAGEACINTTRDLTTGGSSEEEAVDAFAAANGYTVEYLADL